MQSCAHRRENEETSGKGLQGDGFDDVFSLSHVPHPSRRAAEKRLPFELKPNAESIAAMEDLDRGEGIRFDTVEDMMAYLNAED